MTPLANDLRSVLAGLAEKWTTIAKIADDGCEFQEAQTYRACASQLTALLAEHGGEAWVSVADRLPPEGVEVLVYTPDENEADGYRMDFDCIDEGGWFNHNERREHFLMVGGAAAAGPDCVCTGPGEEAPYTHWRRIERPITTPPPQPRGDMVLDDAMAADICHALDCLRMSPNYPLAFPNDEAGDLKDRFTAALAAAPGAGSGE